MSESRVYIENFKDIIQYGSVKEMEVEWCEVKLHVKKHLSLETMMIFVNNVVSSCFDDDTDEYMPEIKDFATRCAILESYTDIVLPEDVSDKYDVVYNTNIISLVRNSIEESQFRSIMNAIDKKVEHRAQSRIEAFNKQMTVIVEGFTNLEHSLSEIFGGIDKETISNIAGAIAGGSFDEGKLVNAFKDNLNANENIVKMPKRNE